MQAEMIMEKRVISHVREGLMNGSTATEIFQSRFGDVVIELSRSIHFPKGLVGMPDKTDFCITEFPHDRMAKFKLMQCLSDASLSFIVLPIERYNAYLEDGDIQTVYQTLEIKESALAMYLIVSIHRGMDAMSFSVNSVAPLFVNKADNTGTQFVFAHTKYQVRQPLSFA